MKDLILVDFTFVDEMIVFKVSFTLHLHKTFLGFELKKCRRRRVVYLNDKFK